MKVSYRSSDDTLIGSQVNHVVSTSCNVTDDHWFTEVNESCNLIGESASADPSVGLIDGCDVSKRWVNRAVSAVVELTMHSLAWECSPSAVFVPASHTTFTREVL